MDEQQTGAEKAPRKMKPRLVTLQLVIFSDLPLTELRREWLLLRHCMGSAEITITSAKATNGG